MPGRYKSRAEDAALKGGATKSQVTSFFSSRYLYVFKELLRKSGECPLEGRGKRGASQKTYILMYLVVLKHLKFS